MEPLVRLSVWLPSEREADLGCEYDQRLLPLLREHGLSAAAGTGRPTVTGVFTRLLVVERPSALASARMALRTDPTWDAALRQLSRAWQSDTPGGQPSWALAPYSHPSGPGRSVDVGTGLSRGLWQSFGVDDGLPVRDISAICQDQGGDLWIGSKGGGICRYDGAVAILFTEADGLADDRVSDLVEDGQGRLWVGTRGGLSCRDGEAWLTYTRTDGLADDAVSDLAEDCQGRLWCGTARGLSHYDGRQWVTFTTANGLADDAVLGLISDHQGRLWCGTAKGVSCYNGMEWVTYTTADGLAHDRVSALAEDHQGRLWCGSWAGGTSCYDGRVWSTDAGTRGLVPSAVLAIAEDHEGRLWFGTHGRGVHRYDGSRTACFTVGDGLANDLVGTLGVDQAGDVWVGSGTGLSRYRQAQFLILTASTGLANNGVTSIGEDRQGAVWFGLFDGRAARYDGTCLTALELPSSDGASVWAIQEDRQGTIWFGTMGSLFAYDGHEVRHSLAAGDPATGCRALAVDRGGNLWAGTGMAWHEQGAGVQRYDGSAWTRFTPADGLASTLTTALAEDRHGRLWLGGGQGGMSVYDGHQFTQFEGLPCSTVTAIAEDGKGRLWVATSGNGVWRWDGQTFTPLVTVGREIYSLATSLVADKEGRLWIGTWGGGVYLHDGQVLQHLSRKDGLVHDAVQALHLDQHGDLWIATEGGATRYRPRNTPPMVRLVDALGDRRYGPVTELEVPVSQKLVAFEFQGRSWTTPPDRMAYVYRLIGFDDTWTTTYRGRVEYHDLPLGDYTFEAKAVDRDLNYSEPLVVRLRLVPDPRLEAFAQALTGAADRFIGRSKALHQVQAQLVQVAPTDLTVLILGETGTGKGLAARTVHHLSPRQSGPFVQVNCGGVPPGLLESELFGHERGAFTGAVARRLGKVELAQGGTLFLDEIGDLPAEGQAKLLRLLEEQTFERVGGTRTLTARMRVIAATNRDLMAMVAAGQFRQDLYFRLQVFAVWLPPLRQRCEDIAELALFFAVRAAAHLHKRVDGIEPAALRLLHDYPWPGNVRELEHAVQRAVIVATGPELRIVDLALHGGPPGLPPSQPELDLPPAEYERRYLSRVLAQTGWVIKGSSGAAARLGISPSTLHDRLRRLGLIRPQGR